MELNGIKPNKMNILSTVWHTDTARGFCSQLSELQFRSQSDGDTSKGFRPGMSCSGETSAVSGRASAGAFGRGPFL